MVSLRSLIAGVALIGVPVAQAITVPGVLDGIGRLTLLTDTMQTYADSITAANAALLLVGQGPFPAIIENLNNIGARATALASELSSTSPVTNARDAKSVSDRYPEFSVAHQKVMNTLISKANLLLRTTGIGQPVSDALRTDYVALGALGPRLSAYSPPTASDINTQTSTLRSLVKLAMSRYKSLL